MGTALGPLQSSGTVAGLNKQLQFLAGQPLRTEAPSELLDVLLDFCLAHVASCPAI